MSQKGMQSAATRLAKTDRLRAFMDKIMGETSAASRRVHINVTPAVNDTAPILQLKAVMDQIDTESLELSVQGQIKKHELAYWYAMSKGNFTAANAAARMQSELAGFLVDRKEVSVKRISDVTRDELYDGAEDAKRELIELGYDPEKIEFNIEAYEHQSADE